jgi:hypothetical protein
MKMLKYIVLLILPFTVQSQELELFYSGKIKLERQDIENLSNDNITNGSSYQKALGHYQLGVIARSEKNNVTAWSHYAYLL